MFSDGEEDPVAHATVTYSIPLGRRLAYGEVTMFSDGEEDPVAHATVTYSIPPDHESEED